MSLACISGTNWLSFYIVLCLLLLLFNLIHLCFYSSFHWCSVCCCELQQWADGVRWIFYNLKKSLFYVFKNKNVYFALHIFLSYRLPPLVLKMILIYLFPDSSSLSDVNDQYFSWHMAWQIKAEIVNGLSSLICFITVFHQAFAMLILNL